MVSGRKGYSYISALTPSLPRPFDRSLLDCALPQQIVDARQLGDLRWMPGGQRAGALGDVERQPDRDLGGGELIERLRFGQRDRALDEAGEPVALEEVVQHGGLARHLRAGVRLGGDPEPAASHLPAAGLDAQRRAYSDKRRKWALTMNAGSRFLTIAIRLIRFERCGIGLRIERGKMLQEQPMDEDIAATNLA